MEKSCRRGRSYVNLLCRWRGFGGIQSGLTNTIAVLADGIKERSFLVLASFRLSLASQALQVSCPEMTCASRKAVRPLRACAFAKASPKPKKSSLKTATLFLKTL